MVVATLCANAGAAERKVIATIAMSDHTGTVRRFNSRPKELHPHDHTE
jgi:hypothetical protein